MSNNDYVLEVSWGCPTSEYPLNGLCQFDQARALAGTGERIVFLALDLRSFRKRRKWGYNRFEKENISVCEYNFPCGPLPPAIKYTIQDFSFKKAIIEIEKEFGVPRVVHVHCMQQAISVTDYCEEKGIPYVITEHITPLDEGASIEQRKEKALKGAKTVIAVSKALARDIRERYGAESTVVPNIADLAEFEYSAKEQKEAFEFLSAASVNYGKGFDVLIKAFAKIVKMDGAENVGNVNHNYHLTIMGDGPEMPAIKDLATQLGVIDRISFTGSYVRKDFAKRLQNSDCFVLPSRSETFGIVYVEALATGTPVIATKCGGPEDFVDDTNGILVPVDDVEALAQAMKQMADDVRESTDRFATTQMKQASDACKERFSPETVAKKILVFLTREI